MEQNLNFEKHNDVGEEIITSETKKGAKKNAWMIIGGKKVWTRRCKHCKNIVTHTNISTFYTSVKHNKKCEKCRQPTGKNNSFYGRKHSKKNIKLFVKNSTSKNNPMYGTLGGMYGKPQSKKQKDNQSRYKKNWWKSVERDTPKIRKYRNKVDSFTRKQPIHTLENYNKRGISGKSDAYQLDHIKSIWYGYHNKIPHHVIGDISNLRFIPWLENQKKWKHSI